MHLKEKLIEFVAKHQQEADKLSDAAKTAFWDDRTVSVFKWMHSLAEAHKEFVSELDEVATLLDNGVTVQEWIPVTERLPEVERSYLTYTDKEHIHIDSFCIYPEHGTRFWVGGNGKVTHWMPLPEPPKGE